MRKPKDCTDSLDGLGIARRRHCQEVNEPTVEEFGTVLLGIWDDFAKSNPFLESFILYSHKETDGFDS